MVSAFPIERLHGGYRPITANTLYGETQKYTNTIEKRQTEKSFTRAAMCQLYVQWLYCQIHCIRKRGRYEITSDIFGRLHYMDRRGSGIRRVMNSYADFDIKPIFYSNEYFFLVSLPNRGNELRSGMKSNKTQLTPDKTQLTDLKIIIQTRAAKSFRKDTLKKIINLLEIYEFAYPFNRQIVATQFGISQNAASRILKKAMECGIIRKERRGIYYFREALVNKDSCYSQEK